MASWPWVLIARPLGQPLDDFPNVARWRETIKERPAVQRGVDLGKDLRRSAPPTDDERRVLFNQTARDVLGRAKDFTPAFLGSAACRRRGSPRAERCRRRSPCWA